MGMRGNPVDTVGKLGRPRRGDHNALGGGGGEAGGGGGAAGHRIDQTKTYQELIGTY